jgi:hypothetical protein
MSQRLKKSSGLGFLTDMGRLESEAGTFSDHAAGEPKLVHSSAMIQGVRSLWCRLLSVALAATTLLTKAVRFLSAN